MEIAKLRCGEKTVFSSSSILRLSSITSGGPVISDTSGLFSMMSIKNSHSLFHLHNDAQMAQNLQTLTSLISVMCT